MHAPSPVQTAATAMLLALAFNITPLAAQEVVQESESAIIAEMRTEIRRMKEAHAAQLAALEARLSELEARQYGSGADSQTADAQPPIEIDEFAPVIATASTAAPMTAPSPAMPSSGSPMQIGLSGLFGVGTSSADNETLAGLQGGAHDPAKIGFTVQNVELSIGATVDPYFDAQANIIFQIDADGETVVELEEAYFTTRALPYGLQLKGGQFFTEFGRQNMLHPHSWAFADQPIVLSRFFGGDGLRSQGLRASWLMPTDWYSEVSFAVQNPRGETVSSFLSAPDEEIGSHVLIDRDVGDFGDMLYSARWMNGLDLSDELSANIGFSALWGPNASGTTTDTNIIGSDLYVKWQSARSQKGFPFISFHSEVLRRHYEAGDIGDPSRETLKDWGMFSQALWGFRPGWVAGVRWEYAGAKGDTSIDPFRDTRKRLSPSLTWYPTEYSKLRLQYNRDSFQFDPSRTADTLWLQFEFSLGSHTAHTF